MDDCIIGISKSFAQESKFIFSSKHQIGIGNTVVMYDKGNGIGENYDGERTEFYYDETYPHKVGDEGLFFIYEDVDGRLKMVGHTVYYPIIDGETTVTTELTKDLSETPIDLDLAKQLAREGQ